MPKYELIQADCLEAMKEIAPGSVDLTVTSPPYDNLRTYSGSLDDWDQSKWQAVVEGLFKVTKEGGAVVWVVADATIKGSETGTSFRQALDFLALGFNLHDTMIWVKDGGGAIGSQKCYTQNFEYMFVFTKGKPKNVNIIKDKVNLSFGKDKSGERIGRRRPTGEHKIEKRKPSGKFSRRNNWWYIAPEKGEHPAVFPKKLAQDHILSWSNFANVVFDPFLGSGTTGVAAMNTGRNFIGIERVPKYFEIAKKRIEDAARDAEDWESVL